MTWNGGAQYVCTHSCVASVQALSYRLKCSSWTKRYVRSAQMFIQLISCVSISRPTHTHTRNSGSHPEVCERNFKALVVTFWEIGLFALWQC